VDIKPELDFLSYLNQQWDSMKEKWPDEHYKFCFVFHAEVKKLLIRNTIAQPLPAPPKTNDGGEK
jgi:hypothetical protein